MTRHRAIAPLRRYLPEICGAAVGAVFGFLFLFVASPANFLSKLAIVSGPNCGKSEKLVSSILADPELQLFFTPLSVSDDEADASVARTCEVAYAHVLENAPWFRIAGPDWVCARLREAAMRYRDEAHAVLPVWVHQGEVVDVNERDRLLANGGYYLLPGGEGVVVRADSPEVEEGSAPPSAASQSEWRGQNIGF